MGIWVFMGTTGSGKTTRAFSEISQAIQDNGNPALIIDSQGVAPLAGVKHYDTWQETARNVWGAKPKNAAYIPKNLEEVNALFKLSRTLKNVNILLDEMAFWVSAKHVSREIELTFRTHLHTGINIYGTTQAAADLSPLVYQTLTGLYAFRCTSPRILDRLPKEYGADREKIRNLERGEVVIMGGGF